MNRNFIDDFEEPNKTACCATDVERGVSPKKKPHLCNPLGASPTVPLERLSIVLSGLDTAIDSIRASVLGGVPLRADRQGLSADATELAGTQARLTQKGSALQALRTWTRRLLVLCSGCCGWWLCLCLFWCVFAVSIACLQEFRKVQCVPRFKI